MSANTAAKADAAANFDDDGRNDDDKLAVLMSMGFDFSQLQTALDKNEGSLDRALDSLLSAGSANEGKENPRLETVSAGDAPVPLEIAAGKDSNKKIDAIKNGRVSYESPCQPGSAGSDSQHVSPRQADPPADFDFVPGQNSTTASSSLGPQRTLLSEKMSTAGMSNPTGNASYSESRPGAFRSGGDEIQGRAEPEAIHGIEATLVQPTPIYDAVSVPVQSFQHSESNRTPSNETVESNEVDSQSEDTSLPWWKRYKIIFLAVVVIVPVGALSATVVKNKQSKSYHAKINELNINISTTGVVSDEPAKSPDGDITQKPTRLWLDSLSDSPTIHPSEFPSSAPSFEPTTCPSFEPTYTPTDSPTSFPTSSPTDEPTHAPTKAPTNEPTHAPTFPPTSSPTGAPTNRPTDAPTNKPTNNPTPRPTHHPTRWPTPRPHRTGGGSGGGGGGGGGGDQGDGDSGSANELPTDVIQSIHDAHDQAMDVIDNLGSPDDEDSLSNVVNQNNDIFDHLVDYEPPSGLLDYLRPKGEEKHPPAVNPISNPKPTPAQKTAGPDPPKTGAGPKFKKLL